MLLPRHIIFYFFTLLAYCRRHIFAAACFDADALLLLLSMPRAIRYAAFLMPAQRTAFGNAVTPSRWQRCMPPFRCYAAICYYAA